MSNEIENTRHSFAHLLASAIEHLYQNAKFGIEPTKIAHLTMI